MKDQDRLAELRQAKIERHVDNLRLFTGYYKGRFRIHGVVPQKPQPIYPVAFWRGQRLNGQ